MKRKLSASILIVFILTVTSVVAQTGKLFPSMACETAEDKKVVLPEATKGKYTIVGLAYSQKAEGNLQTWLQPVYSTFIESSNGLFDESYDVNVYFVPMFTGVNQAAYESSKKKSREQVQKELKPYLLFYKGELDKYKNELKMKEKDSPYIFVLDSDGKIVYATDGAYSDEKMEAIEEILMEEEE